MIEANGRTPTPPGPTWSIIVALPNEMVRCGLSTMLSSLPSVSEIRACADPVETADLLDSRWFDALILAADTADDRSRKVAAEASRHDVKVILFLDGTDPERAAMAAEAIPADGFLLQEELTSDALGDALARLSNGGMPMPAKLARSLLSRVRSDHPARSSRPITLTPREQQALSLLADGLSNKQIARALGISLHSAKRHVANVMAKLNCSNRTMAVAIALREGLLEDRASSI